jgi:spermidine synthase
MRDADNEAKGIWIDESGAGKALLVNGTVQSVSLDSHESLFGYWPLMLPESRPRNALILGLGGGTLAQLLLRRFGPIPITGIDDSEAVIILAETELGLDREAIRVIITDAFEWVTQTKERFDYVAIDLYRGGEVPRRAFSTSFLRSVRELMLPAGRIVANLAQDDSSQERIERLSRLYRVLQTRKAGKNLVVHGQLRRR